ncbi:hypothetical protein QYS36_13515 [Pseudomonas sp. G34]|uniref:hypothetical protein n=1 Tax=Pseudomonas sp. G34 TaxID=3059083 RepID=UPI002807666A|nr:hypothetical protein [Pseudomonas sp. G34]MDQ7985957.1 hypothetical protein [Pseudomonas sp. G34]
MEFFKDGDEAQRLLYRTTGSWKRIQNQLQEIAEYWPGLCERLPGIHTKVTPATTARWRMNGETLGKKFTVTATPLSYGAGDQQKLFAQLVLAVAHPVEEEMAIVSSVLMDSAGAFYTLPERVVLGNEGDEASYHLLFSIINQVLAADAAAI